MSDAAATAQDGGLGGALQLNLPARTAAVATLASAPGGGALTTLRLDADAPLLPHTLLGVEWRSEQRDGARLHLLHTRPEGKPAAGWYAQLELAVQRGVSPSREHASLILGRRFDLTPSVDDAAALD